MIESYDENDLDEEGMMYDFESFKQIETTQL